MSIKLSSYNKVICSSTKGKTFSVVKLALGSEAVSPIFHGDAAVHHANEFATALTLHMLLVLYPNAPNLFPPDHVYITSSLAHTFNELGSTPHTPLSFILRDDRRRK